MSLIQVALFFENSYPDMPAILVLVPWVLDWILEHISTTLDHPLERVLGGENGPSNVGDLYTTNNDFHTSNLGIQIGVYPNGYRYRYFFKPLV